MDPAGVRSVYRLALRAISASVLHSSRSVHLLRRLYRPTFRAGAVIASKLQSPTLQPDERKELEAWLQLWNRRVDGTLKLLLCSAKARGVPDQITRNLSHLMHSYYDMRNTRIFRTAGVWDPQRSDAQREQHMPSPKHLRNKAIEAEVENRAWDGLVQVVHMAESTAGVSLGRMEFDIHIRRHRGQNFRR